VVLALGDLQYEHGEYTNFLRAYDHSWGRFEHLTRPAVGHHEYLDPAGPAAGYFRYFGRQAGNPAKGYYSFDIGPWHAIALNSNCGATGAPSCAHGSAQWSWLKHDLASHHHPYRSSTSAHTGKHELKHLWAQLVAGGVDLVLNGHHHVSERLKPMRTMGDVDDHAPWTVVAGTGGRSLVPITSVHPNSVARAAVYGVYKMVLYPDRWVGATTAPTASPATAGRSAATDGARSRKRCGR
jgi:acid phosphatase type 7